MRIKSFAIVLCLLAMVPSALFANDGAAEIALGGILECTFIRPADTIPISHPAQDLGARRNFLEMPNDRLKACPPVELRVVFWIHISPNDSGKQEGGQ